jgi:hypothetical protein
VQVRLEAVAGVADSREPVAGAHPLTEPRGQRAAAQVGIGRVRPVVVLDDHVVA